MSFLRRYLVAGLLVWMPLGITLLVVRLLVNWMDHSLLLIPEAYRPENLLPDFTCLGWELCSPVDHFRNRVLRRTCSDAHWSRQGTYPGQDSAGAFHLLRCQTAGRDRVQRKGKSFRKVLLIEFPRRGLWTIAFQTGADIGEAQAKRVWM